MKNHIIHMLAASCSAAVLAGVTLPAWADATIQRFTHFGGVLGMGANDTTSVQYLQGDKMRVESNTKFTGAVLGGLQNLMGGSKGTNTVEIMRVDENKRIKLDTDKKTYMEGPIYTPPKPESGEKGGSGGEKDNDTKVTKNELTVKETGAKKDINGFATREYLVTWEVDTENTKTGEKGESLMTTDMWNTEDAKLASVRDQEVAYSRAMLKLMHLPASPEEAKQYGFGTVQLSYVTNEDTKKFLDKLKTIKGYPVSLDVTWQAQGSANQGGTSDSGSSDADKQAAAKQNLSNALGSLFGGSKSGSSSSSGSSAGSDNGMATLFTSHTELKSVDTASLKGDLFSVPDGYKKED